MSTRSAHAVEDALRKLLLPVCALSGTVVVSGFFFRDAVGSVVPGQGWLVVSLLFFASGLTYLALLPLGEERADRSVVPALLRVRHRSPVQSVAGLLDRLAGFARQQDPVAVVVPVAAFAAFFAAQVAAPEATGTAVAAAKNAVLTRFDWLFLGAMFLAVLYALFLLVGPWGDVRLGGPDADPAYTLPTYFALVFTAGIAAGIVFWGPAEALFHYRDPPPFVAADPRSSTAVVGALTYALFHWGVSAWSAYLVVGLPIAYFAYQRGAPLRVSTILTPFVGVDGLDGVWARLVDLLAVVATIGGMATSVAFVSRQFLAGIEYQYEVTVGALAPALFVGGLVVVYVVSAESGVQRGIRRIAGVNVALFALFALLLVLVGPRSFVAEQGGAAVARYVADFVPMSVYTVGAGGQWVADWTVWNWAWWFSWAPFAGLFLAALSKGRRVRTVVLTCVGATAAATSAWFLLVGGTSLSLQHTGTADVLGVVETHGGSEAVAGFPILDALPLGPLLTFCFLALIVVFIVTSADTSTLVVAILATRREYAPTTGSIVFWGVVQGCVALAVLLVGGGDSLQAVAVLTGGPFAVLSLVALVGLTVTFRREERGHPWLGGRTRAALADRGLTLPGRMPDVRDAGDVDDDGD